MADGIIICIYMCIHIVFFIFLIKREDRVKTLPAVYLFYLYSWPVACAARSRARVVAFIIYIRIHIRTYTYLLYLYYTRSRFIILKFIYYFSNKTRFITLRDADPIYYYYTYICIYRD